MRTPKPRLLEGHQLTEYWLVDPDDPAVEAYRLDAHRLVLASTACADQRVASPLLSELDLRPADLIPTASH